MIQVRIILLDFDFLLDVIHIIEEVLVNSTSLSLYGKPGNSLHIDFCACILYSVNLIIKVKILCVIIDGTKNVVPAVKTYYLAEFLVWEMISGKISH